MREAHGPSNAGLDTVVIGAGVVLTGTGIVTWLGARLAALTTGGTVGGGLSDWFTVAGRLAVGHDPNDAWGSLATDLPGPVVYWTATAAVVAATLLVTIAATVMWRRLDPSRMQHVRFGQPTERAAGRTS